MARRHVTVSPPAMGGLGLATGGLRMMACSARRRRLMMAMVVCSRRRGGVVIDMMVVDRRLRRWRNDHTEYERRGQRRRSHQGH